VHDAVCSVYCGNSKLGKPVTATMPKVSLFARCAICYACLAAAITIGCAGDLPSAPATTVPKHGVLAKLELSALPGIGVNGGTATITARALDAFAAAVPDVVVTFGADAGTLSVSSATTDGNGTVATRLTAAPGGVKVTASAGAVSAPEVVVAVQPRTSPQDPPPTPPAPDPTAPGGLSISVTSTGGTPTSPVQFTASVRNGLAPLRFTWAFGDGVTQSNGSQITVHQYGAVGAYPYSVSVTDGSGRSSSVSGTATVTPTPPVPPVPPPTPVFSVTMTAAKTSLIAGESTTLTANVTLGGGATDATSFAWDCTGDGIVDATTSTNTTSCTYPAVGVVTSFVSVTNGTLSASASVTLTVNPPPPPAYSVSLAAAPSTIDPAGTTTLTATVTLQNGATAPTSFAWDCNGDGTTDQTTVSNTANCTLTTSGSATPKVTATNGTTTGSATTTVTVRPVDITVSCGGGTTLVPASCNVTARINGVNVTAQVASVTWSWGDGTPDTTSAGPLSNHLFGQTGEFEVDATVTLAAPHAAAVGHGTVKITIS
jgi:PKD repeat protein